MGLKITNYYSINFSLPKRSKKKIRFIIIHYTGMKREKSAIKKLCNHKSKVSSHYFIKKNGNILRLVPDLYEAWHAGKSSWKKKRFLNKNSIGIEIHNPGHDHGYINFSTKQIFSLKKLLIKLLYYYKINIKNVLGHSDIAPERKKDPGEKFPWKKLAKSKLVKWHNLDEKKLKKFRLKNLNLVEEKLFINNLIKIGYKSNKMTQSNNINKNLFKTFQRRFRQSLINGKPDKECLIISEDLLKT
jgi:N-acetylmuramoyl-L-alanine amidase